MDRGVGDLSRTLTGGLVDLMKTKLEKMVAYMAGRKGEAPESIRRELEDPMSEASQCLEALRSRSRGLFGADLTEMPEPIPSRSTGNRATTRGIAGSRLPSLLVGASSAALVFIAVGMTWRAQDDRLRNLEVKLEKRDDRWGDRFNRLEAALTRREGPTQRQPASSKAPIFPEPKPQTSADRPTSLALARIEARLGELEQQLGQGQPMRDQDDQQVAQLRRDLDRLSQEVEIAVRTRKQESQKLSTAVREILELLRRLTMNSGAMAPMQVPGPIPIPPQGQHPGVGQGPGMMPGPEQVPGQAQMPGQESPRWVPGRGKR
jgi:hypothetical protein